MFQELQRRIDTAKELDFGSIFQRSLDLFKETWVQGLILTLISIAITLPLIMLIYIPMIVYGIADPSAFEQGDLAALPIFIMAITLIVVIVIISALSFALQAAFFKMIKKIDHKETNEDVNFFMYFKQPYLKKSLILSLALIGIALASALLCYLPLIYAIVPLQFFVLFFAFHPELSISEVIKLSFKLGNKKWLITFGLILVAGILAQFVGMLLCFVGVFFTASFGYLPLYHIYKDVIGFDNQPEIFETNSI